MSAASLDVRNGSVYNKGRADLLTRRLPACCVPMRCRSAAKGHSRSERFGAECRQTAGRNRIAAMPECESKRLRFCNLPDGMRLLHTKPNNRPPGTGHRSQAWMRFSNDRLSLVTMRKNCSVLYVQTQAAVHHASAKHASFVCGDTCGNAAGSCAAAGQVLHTVRGCAEPFRQCAVQVKPPGDSSALHGHGITHALKICVLLVFPSLS